MDSPAKPAGYGHERYRGPSNRLGPDRGNNQRAEMMWPPTLWLPLRLEQSRDSSRRPDLGTKNHSADVVTTATCVTLITTTFNGIIIPIASVVQLGGNGGAGNGR